MKEVGAALAGEMSGHTFFKERWYGFDDGLYAGARLLEILSRHADPSARARRAARRRVDARSSTSRCAEGEHHALVAKLRRDGAVSRRDRRRSASTACASSIRTASASRAASNTTPSIVLRFEADDAAALDAHQGRVPPRARQPRSPASRCRSERGATPPWSRSPTSKPPASASPAASTLALRRVDPAVAAHGRAHLLQARLPAAHRQLQGARRAQRAAAPDRPSSERRGVIAASAG